MHVAVFEAISPEHDSESKYVAIYTMGSDFLIETETIATQQHLIM